MVCDQNNYFEILTLSNRGSTINRMEPKSGDLMKNFAISILVVWLLIIMGGFQAQAEPEITAARHNVAEKTDAIVVFGRIFAPNGFDSDENAQIVAEGEFKSSCAGLGRTSLQIDRSRFEITVGAAINIKPGACSPGHFTFHREISLGYLAPGKWTIKDATSGSELGRVEIQQAHPDSETVPKYAPVDKAFFKVGPQSAQIMVTGNYSNSCLALSEVRVQIQQDVIVLQPIVQESPGDNCIKGKFPFSSWTSLDFLKPGRFLIHIRGAQGHAINSIIDVPGNES